MNTKSRIKKSQWTNFWKDLQVYIKKIQRFSRNYKPKSDERKLLNIGVDSATIDSVRRKFENSYQDPLIQFHRFNVFFGKDPETVMIWTKTTSKSAAYTQLLNKLHLSNLPQAKSIFQQLYLLYKLNERGEGRTFEAKYVGRGSLQTIDSRPIASLLSSKHENASYKGFSSFKVGDTTILSIVKNSEGRDVYKFIRLTRKPNKVLIDISADTSKEINIIKQKLSLWFNSYIDTPEADGDFSKLLKFIKEGISDHFSLIGINYFDDGYKVSVFPQYNQQNISEYRPFKQKFSGSSVNTFDRFINIRVSNKEIQTKGQVFVNFFSYFNGGLIGAITLQLDDRRLNFPERKKIREDFETDFGLPLGKLIRFETTSDEEIYRTFLQNTPKKQRKVELRIDSAMKIYTNLLSNNLIAMEFESKNEACFCFNKYCRLAYRRQWNLKTCPNCGGLMLNDKKIVVSAIEEDAVAKFIYNKGLSLGLEVEKFSKSLVRRKIKIVEIRNNDKSICIIPLTKSLNEHQVEILRLRYPNAVLITSKDDARSLKETTELEVYDLYQFVPKLFEQEKQFLIQLINKIHRTRLDRIRALADQSISRITNIPFYQTKNGVSKNFGAEFFEADCSALLTYIFGNSIWLGASKRGSAFPDGITALPLVNTKYGCYVWDSKFYLSGNANLGSDNKNSKYIKDGKKNRTIISNGGLKGFLFISNANPPNNFATKYKKLARKSGRMKITFVKTAELVTLFNYFKEHEEEIGNNSRIKGLFFDEMKKTFFSVSKKQAAMILTDVLLKKTLDDLTPKIEVYRTPSLSP